jgi:hypothetical protein
MKALLILSLLSPLTALADLQADITSKGIYSDRAVENTDGSITILYPRLLRNGQFAPLHLKRFDSDYSSQEEREFTQKRNNDVANAVCSLAGLGKSISHDSTRHSGINSTAVSLRLTADGKADIWTEVSSGYVFSKVECGPKASAASNNAAMEEALRILREVNGIDLRPDGSVVIDSRIAKKITIKGEGDAEKAAHAEPAT